MWFFFLERRKPERCFLNWFSFLYTCSTFHKIVHEFLWLGLPRQMKESCRQKKKKGKEKQKQAYRVSQRHCPHGKSHWAKGVCSWLQPSLVTETQQRTLDFCLSFPKIFGIFFFRKRATVCPPRFPSTEDRSDLAYVFASHSKAESQEHGGGGGGEWTGRTGSDWPGWGLCTGELKPWNQPSTPKSIYLAWLGLAWIHSYNRTNARENFDQSGLRTVIEFYSYRSL